MCLRQLVFDMSAQRDIVRHIRDTFKALTVGRPCSTSAHSQTILDNQGSVRRKDLLVSTVSRSQARLFQLIFGVALTANVRTV